MIQMQRRLDIGAQLELWQVFCPNSKWQSHAQQNYDGLRKKEVSKIYELICRNKRFAAEQS